jgi:hypothetical protein
VGLISADRRSADIQRLLIRVGEVVAILVEVDGGLDSTAVQDVTAMARSAPPGRRPGSVSDAAART